jgi:hypothetical protein
MLSMMQFQIEVFRINFLQMIYKNCLLNYQKLPVKNNYIYIPPYTKSRLNQFHQKLTLKLTLKLRT